MPQPKAKDVHYPTSIRLPEKLRDFLREEATRQKRTITFVIVEVLEQYKAFKNKEELKAPKRTR